jgi:hypothetical protein
MRPVLNLSGQWDATSKKYDPEKNGTYGHPMINSTLVKNTLCCTRVLYFCACSVSHVHIYFSLYFILFIYFFAAFHHFCAVVIKAMAGFYSECIN